MPRREQDGSEGPIGRRELRLELTSLRSEIMVRVTVLVIAANAGAHYLPVPGSAVAHGRRYVGSVLAAILSSL